MFNGRKYANSNLVSLITRIVLLVVTFALIGFVALSVLIGNGVGRTNNTSVESLTPNPEAVIPEVAVGTPDPSDFLIFRSSALGFSVDYPRTWRKNEQGLRVIFSPSAAGLDPDGLQDAAIWFGIPTDNTVNPTALLTRVQSDLLPSTLNSPARQLDEFQMVIGGQAWPSAQFNIESERLGGSVIATIAAGSKNDVGYFAVAIAPAEQWDSIEPTFQKILDSFQFTTEAVLRPTDATPPPTPTATPTPVIYVVQSGDTLLQIALQYDVDVEALAARNGIEDPRSLRTGARLVIPMKRRR